MPKKKAKKLVSGRSRNPKHLRTEVTYYEFDALKERVLTLEIEKKSERRILDMVLRGLGLRKRRA